MSDYRWPSQFTCHGRYEQTGVTDRVLEYVRTSGKNKIKILDVGCSVGIAIKDMQTNLKRMGIETETTGMDRSVKVKVEAEKNLDHFILGGIMSVKPSPEYDVVICSKMILHAGAKTRARIVCKCSRFLKPDGALITDADCYDFPSMAHNFKEDVLDSVKVLLSLRHGPRASYHTIKDIQEFRLKRKMHLVVGREYAEEYSISILTGWKKLNPFDKFFVWSDDTLNRLLAYTNRKPNYKKRK